MVALSLALATLALWLITEASGRRSWSLEAYGFAPHAGISEHRVPGDDGRCRVYAFDTTPEEAVRWIKASPAIPTRAKGTDAGLWSAEIVSLLGREPEIVAAEASGTLSRGLREESYYFLVMIRRGRDEERVSVVVRAFRRDTAWARWLWPH